MRALFLAAIGVSMLWVAAHGAKAACLHFTRQVEETSVESSEQWVRLRLADVLEQYRKLYGYYPDSLRRLAWTGAYDGVPPKVLARLEAEYTSRGYTYDFVVAQGAE